MTNNLGNVRINVKMGRVRVTIVTVLKAVRITYSECVSVALVMQHGIRMRRVTLLAMTCLPLPYFFHIFLSTARLSDKKSTEREMWVLSSCTVWNMKHETYCVILRETESWKDRAVPLQACSGPEGSRKLRFPDIMTTAQDGGKVVSLTHRPPLPPGNTPGTHFC